MYELTKKMERYFTSKFVGTRPLFKKKNLQGRGLTKVEKHCYRLSEAILEYTIQSVQLKNMPLIFTVCILKVK